MDKIIKALQDIIIEKVNTTDSTISEIKTVYAWDPRQYNESNLPAIYIEPKGIWVEQFVSYDRVVYNIEIWVLFPEKYLYWENGIDWKKVTIKVKEKIQNIVRSTGDDWIVKDDCIYWIIRDNPCAVENNNEIANDINITNVEFTPSNARGSFITYEARVTINAKWSINNFNN